MFGCSNVPMLAKGATAGQPGSTFRGSFSFRCGSVSPFLANVCMLCVCIYMDACSMRAPLHTFLKRVHGCACSPSTALLLRASVYVCNCVQACTGNAGFGPVYIHINIKMLLEPLTLHELATCPVHSISLESKNPRRSESKLDVPLFHPQRCLP